MNRPRKLTDAHSDDRTVPDSNLALLVMPHDCNTLVGLLGSMDLDVVKVEHCWQARRIMERCLVPRLIVTGVSLSDGNWCGLLRLTLTFGLGCPVILSCTSADERLWSEALWRGVYDLLIEPYEHDQVQWVVEGALRSSRVAFETRTRHPGPSQQLLGMTAGEDFDPKIFTGNWV